ncbi:MAG: 16S rRNA (guanine(966)-N(2))-methyltransferase RsmD [Bdellovibrionales bacterium]|nr:16S rRNA (guanine(966)-N(2))-methyltransferase RsmD [Bdellovibrionales bacterium]
MRVVSGKAKGTKLSAVPGTTTRPILDRVKTALFDILRPSLSGKVVLDLFAGSGGVGIEALSQGAGRCVFIDVEKSAVKTIRANLEATHLSEWGEVRQTEALLFLRKENRVFDYIYVAPPQYKNLWQEALRALAEKPSLLAPDGQIICQIDPLEYEPLLLEPFSEFLQRKYGNTLLVFFQHK